MAAREQVRPLRLNDLRSVSPASLDPILKEERGRWRALLHWDFAPSANLVARYVQMQALDGFVLMDDEEPAGYIYWVSEDHKGLIGDLYLRDAWRSPANENMLLSAALTQLRRNPWLHRVEAQLMQLTARGSQVFPAGLRPRAFARNFMLAGLDGLEAHRPMITLPTLRLEHWGPRWMEDSASLIGAVYSAHVDSEINDQYHSPQGARRFLQNIVQYPGCGEFSHECSFVALDQQGRVRGLSLASTVAPEVGHIAQICLAREFQGTGAGYELLRLSLASLKALGAAEASLTVTGSNHRAIRLYERFGFRTIHQFEALVWENLWG
jgi:ribosomal protein S18 acetylase RimI-like enzyme